MTHKAIEALQTIRLEKEEDITDFIQRFKGVMEQLRVVRSDFELQQLVLLKEIVYYLHYLCKSFKFQFVAFCLSNRRIDCLFVDGQLFLYQNYLNGSIKRGELIPPINLDKETIDWNRAERR